LLIELKQGVGSIPEFVSGEFKKSDSAKTKENFCGCKEHQYEKIHSGSLFQRE
jgi:hypothetical protein